MRKLLITGGTVFVSRFAAEYFVKKGDQVYVLNRNSRPQPEGVTLIEADRSQLGDCLKGYEFDGVLDITAYTKGDVRNLVEGLGQFGAYIFVSSSAVYPESLPQPFGEDMECGPNSVWGAYGTNKLEAEEYLREAVPGAYVLRPPYLYGPMQNVYRDPFVFDCADENRPFCIPGQGEMKLQFFHVEDLCRFMDILLEKKPEQHVFNVGNPEPVDIRSWVQLCYEAAGKKAQLVSVDSTVHQQRSYFPFYDYEYELDVTRQTALMTGTKDLLEGLRDAYRWYSSHKEQMKRKPYIEYIEENQLYSTGRRN